MAFSANKLDANLINNGNYFSNGQVLDANVINNLVDAELYSNEMAEKMPQAVVSANTAKNISNVNRKKIKGLEDEVYKSGYLTDDYALMVKDVPENAAYYAEVTKLGGQSFAKETNNLLRWIETVAYSLDDSANTYKGLSASITEDGIRVKGVTANQKGHTISLGGLGASIVSLPSISSSKQYTLSGLQQKSTTIGYDGVYPEWYWGISYIKQGGGTSMYVDKGDGLTIPVGAYMSSQALFIKINMPANTEVDFTIKPMFNEGDTALPFENQAHIAPSPITRVVGSQSIVIPNSLLDLPDYGQGYGDVYNYIEWLPEKGIYVYHRNCKTRLNNSSYDFTEAIYSYGKYKLVQIEEEVYDVSNLLSDDNILMVTPNGTVTFENEANLDVPSEIVYLIKEG